MSGSGGDETRDVEIVPGGQEAHQALSIARLVFDIGYYKESFLGLEGAGKKPAKHTDQEMPRRSNYELMLLSMCDLPQTKYFIRVAAIAAWP